MENKDNIAIKIVWDSFKSNLQRASKLLEELSDEQLALEISPSKNTGHYLLGHLIAVNDNILPLLGLGQSLYSELVEVFIKNADKSGLEKPTISQLRKQWHVVNKLLLEKIELLTYEQLLEKHTSVSNEDFAKEPHRNKLNVVLSRANHLAYHVGQIALLKK